jgi:hypothetical protein
MCELHSEPQTRYPTFFKTEVRKNNNDYDSSGIYGLCQMHLNYFDQTGQILKQRYPKHIQSTIGSCQSYCTTWRGIWNHTKIL